MSTALRIPPRQGTRWGALLRGCALAFVLALFIRTLATADLRGAVLLIEKAGPTVAAILVPFAAAIAFDTLALRIVFRVLWHSLGYARLLQVRIIAEAVTLSLPAGAVFAETLNPLLLRHRLGVPVAEGIVACTAKRWLTTRAQAGYIVLSVVLGYPALARASVPLIGVHGLPWIVLSSALLPLVLSSLVASSLGGGTWMKRLQRALRALPIKPLRAWLDRRHDGFAASDVGFGRIGAATRAKLVFPTLLLLSAWLLESLETLVILRVLGASISYWEVIAFEAGLALVRNLSFFAPAGLGVQDVGYIAFFRALGMPDASALGAAFVVLKRAKELVWIVTGYALLVHARRSPEVPIVAPAEALS